ncbi:HNH endonuclease [Roseofilum sp. BLCC_M154]|uniref:HNH endonuclease n=1 Tax=Roseofilum acuticapitatum BLCC-M154 TaxID=3022444 RepID=A0ABT7APT4_9CYAN|nr:hypothetical protein [Roseofilum acuticapitatum]MDJ1168914.1 HNH endonuclease [Roseofilum acuticapitatum BLCC-M154]
MSLDNATHRSRDRYPENWNELSASIKAAASWRCQKCGKQCIRPQEKTPGLSVSERRARTLNVHHRNFKPEDNRLENLVALCTGCHLGYHQNRRGNVSPGQLELW